MRLTTKEWPSRNDIISKQHGASSKISWSLEAGSRRPLTA